MNWFGWRKTPRYITRQVFSAWELAWWVMLERVAPPGFRIAPSLPLGYVLDTTSTGRVVDELFSLSIPFLMVQGNGYPHKAFLTEHNQEVETALRQAGLPFAYLSGQPTIESARALLGVETADPTIEEEQSAAPQPTELPAVSKANTPLEVHPENELPTMQTMAAMPPGKPALPLSFDEVMAREISKRFWQQGDRVSEIFVELIARGKEHAHADTMPPTNDPDVSEDNSSQDSTNPPPSQDSKSDTKTPQCPKCGAPMVLKTARKGNRAGSKFWGCTRYPDCKATLSV